MRVLLEGTTGVNLREIQRATKLAPRTIRSFVSGSGDCLDYTVDEIARFIWRRMNRNVLISPEDLQ